MESPKPTLKPWQLALLVIIVVIAGLAVLKWSLKLLGSLLMLLLAGFVLWLALRALSRRNRID